MRPVGIMHLVYTLDPGGAERVAVNICNHLPKDRFTSHLCATRSQGALLNDLLPHVSIITLQRKNRLDFQAARRLDEYNHQHEIRILHAHSTSVFLAVFASFLNPGIGVLWHVHSGRYVSSTRYTLLYWLATRKVVGVVAANQSLASWAHVKLGFHPDRVWYMPNFVMWPEMVSPLSDLPGFVDSRIVCVANMRAEKGLINLIRAMKEVAAQVQKAHLLIVGAPIQPGYKELVRSEIDRLGLNGSVTFMGRREDVPAILKSCAVGVISSLDEGLPLALLEYGAARLGVVSTRVGECAEVLENGKAGLLVEPDDTFGLAQAILSLLESPDLRQSLGQRFQRRVEQNYSMHASIQKICQVYDNILSK